VNFLYNHIAGEGLSCIDIVFKQSETLQSICGATGSELDLSNQYLGAEDAKLIAIELKHTQTLCVLNLTGNRLGANVLPAGWMDVYKSSYTTGGLPYRHEDGTEQKDRPGKSEGIIAVVAALKENTTLLSLHVGQNGIPKKEMKEIMAIATNKESMTILCGVPFKDKAATELDISEKQLGDEGALVVAQYLDGSRALSIANILGNKIGMKQLAMLQELMNFKPGLASLCGIEDSTTELNLSDLRLDAGDATLLASELPSKRALSKLTFVGNGRVPLPVTMEISMTEADITGKDVGPVGASLVAAFLPKCR
jgi:hypothetical protein